jgi:hypothetical protein
VAQTDTERVATLLQEAAETHHRVFRITDGVDEDWASWYADWLLDLSELSDLLGARPVRSHLVHALVQLDRDHPPWAPMTPGPRSMPAACTNSSARRRRATCSCWRLGTAPGPFPDTPESWVVCRVEHDVARLRTSTEWVLRRVVRPMT